MNYLCTWFYLGYDMIENEPLSTLTNTSHNNAASCSSHVIQMSNSCWLDNQGITYIYITNHNTTL